jgi:hypothetical protein
MRRLHIIILDLVAKGPARKPFARIMNPNQSTIMPQAVAVWCEQLGHDVRYLCYTGSEDLGAELAGDTDLVFISAYSRSALTGYAVSNLFRSRAAVTVLGGPHARCYPQDAARYFDYVLGFTDKAVLDEVLRECAPHRPIGRQLSAAGQPPALPTLRQRWKFIEPNLAKAHFLKIVPMIGSMGCPYQCSFCIDSQVPYQALTADSIRDDLRFLLTKMRRPRVAWHDPLFGVRFNEFMTIIEEAVPAGSIRFIAEISLSLLSEPHVRRLASAGFDALLPGIESWYSFGNKSKSHHKTGEEKVRQIAEHINMIQSYVPYVQANFVLGLDCDQGEEPFALTKRFLDLAPGAWPAFSMFTAYGRAAPLNLELQRERRVVPLPFPFLDSHWMNVRPKNYSWSEMYAHAADLTQYALCRRQVYRRFRANRGFIPSALNIVRALSTGRVKKQTMLARLMQHDLSFRRFFELESDVLPALLENRVRRHLGALWEYLPREGLIHDPNAYLKAARPKVSDSPA